MNKKDIMTQESNGRTWQAVRTAGQCWDLYLCLGEGKEWMLEFCDEEDLASAIDQAEEDLRCLIADAGF
jgi:hypothetical protein